MCVARGRLLAPAATISPGTRRDGGGAAADAAGPDQQSPDHRAHVGDPAMGGARLRQGTRTAGGGDCRDGLSVARAAGSLGGVATDLEGTLRHGSAGDHGREFPPYSSSIPASPSNSRKPQTSVNVVTKIDDATAGSMPNRSNRMGMNAPANPATIRFPVIARNTTSPSRAPCPINAATVPTATPMTRPLMMPTRISLPTTRVKTSTGISPRAS